MKTVLRASAFVAAAVVIFCFIPSFSSMDSSNHWKGKCAMPQDYYAEQWKRVEEALRKGLPKSALEIVEDVYKRAKKEGVEVQVIKAASYRVGLRAELSDAGDSLLIADLQAEIASSSPPGRSIFQSLLAEMFWGYYQANRWVIAERTEVEGVKGEDFRTWDARRFFDTARSLYVASLEPVEVLGRADVKKYAEIMYHTEETDVVYRPTLLDVLADRALSFLENDETDLPRATHEFEVTSLDALAPAADFVGRVFETPSENDPRWTALKCFQSLLRFHLSDPSPEALVDLDLRRLDFARRITLHEEKDDAWRRELERLRGVYRGHAISSEIAYRLAQDLFDRGEAASAFSMCDLEIQRFPGSRGATNCKSLQSRILEKELRVDAEETIPPDMPFLVAVSHRNIRHVFFRIVPMEEDDFERTGYSWSFRDFLGKLLQREAVAVFDTELPPSDDFRKHTVDIAGPRLPLGRYILLGSPLQSFPLDTNAVSLTRMQVTRLSMQSQSLSNGMVRCWVRDGETGHPVPDVEVSVYAREWKSASSRYARVFVQSEKTGADGSFDLKAGESPRSVSVVLRKGKDVLIVDETFSPYRRREHEVRDRTVFFTDRGLYRPGQTLYFKGVLFRTSADQVRMETRPGVNTTVVFLDANKRTIAEQQFVTNAYGSFNGSFTIPTGVLTGVMTIRNETGSVSIRVEEYKRPKFEVTFDPVGEAAALGNEVTVHGSARAYADVQIDNAEVRYRVVRRARFPHWWWWWSPAPSSPAKEIAHGTTRTDADGRFHVTFTAVPDKSVDRTSHPVFTYTVTADVTDINGETHGASVSVNAGYSSIMLSTDIPDYVNTAESPALRILSSNLNGRPLPVKGSAVLERVRMPDRVLRKRFLPRPDRFIMAPGEFHRLFPRDAYGGEADEDSLPAEATLYDGRFATDTTGTHSLAVPALPPGRYRLTVRGDDPSGDTVTIRRFFTVYDPSSKRMPVTDDALLILLTPSAEPGRTVSFLFGTSFPDARVLYQVEHRGVIVKSEWVVFDREVKSFTVPVEEKHRGGFTIRFAVQAGYRFACEERFINVPWTNKQLTVETAVFRDKLKPGAREEWKLTIRGEKSEAVTAEIVAAMYDASLDAIVPFSWPCPRHAMFPPVSPISAHTFGLAPSDLYSEDWNRFLPPYSVIYPSLHLYLLEHGFFGFGSPALYLSKGMDLTEEGVRHQQLVFDMPSPRRDEKTVAMPEREMGEEKDRETEKTPAGEEGGKGAGQQGEGSIQPRKRFDETAFFYPVLSTGEQGETILSFTVPEALTRWKLQAFAHTPDMKTGSLVHTAVTQKELMVVPNAPRFFREGDEMEFPVKVSNLADTALEGWATLEMFDAFTMQPMNAAFGIEATPKPFRCARGAGAVVSWSLRVPESVDAIVYRVVARAGAFSDGEEAPLPVLPNRMLVTESMPMNIRGRETRTFRFEKLASSGTSKTLRHRKLTLEVTSNPAWYAVQALPYIMEFPYECSEQVFNRFYANSLAAHIVRSNPRIERVFSQWKGTDALLSNLEKREDLKSVLLQETPWVLQGRDESERKRRIALLFDLNGMAQALEDAFRTLEKMQGANGGFPWFPGMPESRYITQYIVAGMGHLRTLGVDLSRDRELALLRRAVEYCDRQMAEDYERLKRSRDFNPAKDYLGELAVQYLYARSFFLGQEIAREHREAVEFWKRQAREHWLGRPLISQGMIALALYRFHDEATPKGIVASLRERSLWTDEMGMYWKQNAGWFWYQAPIETQAVLIETFDEVARDAKAVEEMKIWLLKQKQVQDWKTTVATADAVYALLLRGRDPLASEALVEVVLGGVPVDPRGEGRAPEAGTGYYSATWNGTEIKPQMGTAVVTKRDEGIAWGALYWQYFERLDRITPAKSPLSVRKTLFRKSVTDEGEILEPVTEANPLHVGDILTARIEIRVDRDMEYIHLKDMRGAGFEPLNQLSGFKWRGGLGYYEAPKDASVNFFIHWLPKGVHVFEYSIRVTHRGVFSNGITTIQSMYAPEFAAHTEGFVVQVR